MRDFHLTGAQVLRPWGWDGSAVGISGGRLTDETPGRRVDLSGWWLMPGIVDPHGDAFERHLAPRRGAVLDMHDGLVLCAGELAMNGITTATLAQFFSWEGGMRSPEFAARMLEAHAEIAPGQALDLRVQLRLETHLIDRFPEAAELVTRYGIDYLVFNDHVPHDALSKGKRPPRLTGQALKSGRSPDAHLALLHALHERSSEVPSAVRDLIATLPERIFGSHDDADAATRAEWREMGVKVSEFPETRAAAEEARSGGDAVILGAPNVVRGGSHSGKVSAAELVEAGLCDGLASDYHYPAPRQAALRLAPVLGIERAWRLVSSGPASVLGLKDRGEISAGLRADLIAVDPQTGRVGATIAGGRLAWIGTDLAGRFFGE